MEQFTMVTCVAGKDGDAHMHRSAHCPATAGEIGDWQSPLHEPDHLILFSKDINMNID
jgi:hypothetical protein